MRSAVLENESQRLQALRSLDLLDTPTESDFDELVYLAAQVCGVPISLVSLVDAERQWFKAVVGLTVRETPREVSFCSHAILNSELFVVEDATKDPRFADNGLVTGAPAIRFYAGMPLITPDGFAMGTLCVIDLKPRQLTPEQEYSLRLLAGQVRAKMQLRLQKRELEAALREKDRIASELGRANEQLRELATTDMLTGLRNRRVFEDRAELEFEIARRQGHDLSVIIMDIDNFKRRNDTWGHGAGDTVLRQMGKILNSAVRPNHLAARYGGEEFVLLLPQTDAIGAARIAERVRRKMGMEHWEHEHVTVSLGTATLRGDTLSASHMVRSADRALYAAKRAGKDRTLMSSDKSGIWIAPKMISVD